MDAKVRSRVIGPQMRSGCQATVSASHHVRSGQVELRVKLRSIDPDSFPECSFPDSHVASTTLVYDSYFSLFSLRFLIFFSITPPPAQ
jgi:hypothetical protein